MDQPLNVLDLKVINWIEYFWHKYSKFPLPKDWMAFIKNKDELADYSLEEALQNATFRLSLKERGVQSPASMVAGWGLTTEQVAAIVTVTNFEDTRPRHVKLRELGISAAKWGGWMKNDMFVDFLQEMTSSTLKNSLHVANEGLMKAMDRGDVHAIKFFYEITDRHGGSADAVRNVRMLLARVFEAIQMHVADPDKLSAIGRDFEIIMSGGTPEHSKPKELGI